MRSATSIIASTIIATGLTELNLLMSGKKSFQPIISGFIIGTGLLLLAFLSVDIAVMFSYMILLSSVLFNAKGILEQVNG